MSSNLQSELEAIRHGAAFAPISARSYEGFARAFLRITGSDATRWLNGMVTNSVQALQPGEGNYNFLLNAQGRIQGDCTIYREPGDGPAAFLLETGSSQLETVSQLLDKFIIMDDVELAPAFHDKLGMIVLGPGAVGTLDVTLMWPKPSISISRAEGFGDSYILAMAENQFEVWTDSWTVDWMGKIERKVSPEALEAYRILSGIPRFGTDIRDRDLPQETNQPHALHFAKGCYLGQEIVERIRSRGQVHRLFTAFTLEGELPSSLPAPLEAAGKPAGEITSAMRIPLSESEGGEQILALGYARREALDAKQPLTYAGGTATPRNIG